MMKTRMLALAMVFCAMAAVAFAADPNVGSWKLNEAKSKLAPGSPKNVMVVYTAEGDRYKCVVDGVDGAGKPTHNEWIGMFDGKDYPVKGDPTTGTRSIQMVKAGHYALNNKKDGKITVTGTIDFSAAGKTRTLVTEMTDPAGKKVTSTAVYERQ